MENEKLMMVLKEILEEQQNHSKLLININQLFDELEMHLEKIEEKSNHDTMQQPNIADIEKSYLNKLEEIKFEIGKMQRNATVVKRILFFPESNAKEYYSAVFRWIVYFTMVICCYLLISKVIDNYSST